MSEAPSSIDIPVTTSEQRPGKRSGPFKRSKTGCSTCKAYVQTYGILRDLLIPAAERNVMKLGTMMGNVRDV